MFKKYMYITLSAIMIGFAFSSYSVGQTVSISDQQNPLEVCNGHEPNGYA